MLKASIYGIFIMLAFLLFEVVYLTATLEQADKSRMELYVQQHEKAMQAIHHLMQSQAMNDKYYWLYTEYMSSLEEPRASTSKVLK